MWPPLPILLMLPDVQLFILTDVHVCAVRLQTDVIGAFINEELASLAAVSRGDISGLLSLDPAAITAVLTTGMMFWSAFSGMVLGDNSAVDRAWSVAPMLVGFTWVLCAQFEVLLG